MRALIEFETGVAEEMAMPIPILMTRKPTLTEVYKRLAMKSYN